MSELSKTKNEERSTKNFMDLIAAAEPVRNLITLIGFAVVVFIVIDLFRNQP